jgi:tetratricopeptide (TPR) repeat protein
LAQRWGGRSATNSAWGGLKMFRESQLPPDDPGRPRVRAHFENNLEAIVRSGIRAGVPVVLSTVAVNLKDCGPFASLPTSRLEGNARADFVRWLETGRTNEAAGDWAAAREAYTQAAAIDPRFAELEFRLGGCLVHLDRPSEARTALERACESDALPFRADAAINAAIQRVAARHTADRVISVDSAQQLAAAAPTRIPGRESFFEHVHPNFEGNYRLARTLAEAVVPLLPETARRNAAADWADPGLCARRLGLTDWNRYAVIESVLRRTSDAPYTNQLTSLEDRRFLAGQLAELRTRMTPDQYPNAYALYREALSRRTDDFRLHENYAEFLEAIDHLSEAVTEWETVRGLIPHHFAAYANLGR